MIEVVPINDVREHSNGVGCWCLPVVEYLDETGLPYAEGPIVIHNAADGRP